MIRQGTHRIAFIGGTRYSRPLDPTNAKKFQLLAPLGEIFVIGFSGGLKPARFKELANFYLLPKWPSSLLRYLTLFSAGPVLALWLIWRHRVRLLVAQSPYEGCAAAWAKVVARWLGWSIALVVESHTDFEKTIFLQRRVRMPQLYRFMMRRAALWALKEADLLRAVSRSTCQQLQQWAPDKKIVQFVAWTDMEAFLAARNQPASDNRATIVFVGALIPRKCVHVLLDAFVSVADAFPDAYLLIIGDPSNREYRGKLEDQRRRSSAAERILFCKSMQQQELAKQLAGARALVLPSSSEGLGRVVLEAMAAGIPAIGTSIGGIPDMIEDGSTGFLVPPNDAAALAERLRWVLAHPEECAAMGERARSFARAFFSPPAYLSSYQHLCESAQESVNSKGEAANK